MVTSKYSFAIAISDSGVVLRQDRSSKFLFHTDTLTLQKVLCFHDSVFYFIVLGARSEIPQAYCSPWLGTCHVHRAFSVIEIDDIYKEDQVSDIEPATKV